MLLVMLWPVWSYHSTSFLKKIFCFPNFCLSRSTVEGRALTCSQSILYCKTTQTLVGNLVDYCIKNSFFSRIFVKICGFNFWGVLLSGFTAIMVTRFYSSNNWFNTPFKNLKWIWSVYYDKLIDTIDAPLNSYLFDVV